MYRFRIQVSDLLSQLSDTAELQLQVDDQELPGNPAGEGWMELSREGGHWRREARP